jgi:DNA-binding MltR family transcriptional regulator
MKKQLSEFFKFDEVVEFRNTLDEETDRGVALMAASFLEGELEDLLREYFVQDKVVINEIFSFNGPCGTFSSKINLTYALGLIGKQARRDLHLIRKIRNEFGHTATPLTFQDHKISNRCNELYYDALDFDVTPRTKFTRVAVGILAFIHAAFFTMQKCEAAKDYELSDEVKEEARKVANELMDEINNN